MKNLKVVENTVIQDALSRLRNKNTDTQEFRYYSDRLCNLLISNALEESDTVPVEIQTPLSLTSEVQLTEDFIITVILRSGVAMLTPAIKLLPKAKIGFAGIYRDERTALPHEYYWKMPYVSSKSSILILDPMLATGGSVLSVLEKLMKEKPKSIRLVSIVGAPEGVRAVHKKFPDVKIYLAALDTQLNSRKYILPGLGDFGDRYFDTPTDEELIRKGKRNNRHWYE